MSLNKETYDRLKRFEPIGWYGHNTVGLAPGAEWATCPDCGEMCVWFKGRPTAMHAGGIPDGEDDE